MAGLLDISLGNYTKVGYFDTTEMELDNIQSIGSLSDEATVVDVQEFNTQYLRKLVGSKNAGPIEIVCNYDDADVGQLFLNSLYTSNETNAMSLYFTDQSMETTFPPTAGTKLTFNGIVASRSFSSEFDSVRTVTYSIVIADGVTGPTILA